MKGLITKEFINLSKSFYMIGALAICYVMIALVLDNPSIFSGTFTIVFAMLLFGSYSLDEMANWDNYVLTMPVTRDNIVQSKYIMLIILSLLGFIVNGSLLLLANWMFKSECLFYEFEVPVGGVVVVIIFYSIMIPIITKLGVVKARLYFFLVYMVLFLLGSFAFKSIKKDNPNPPEIIIKTIDIIIENAYIIVPLFILLILGISYIISLRIYRKKEF